MSNIIDAEYRVIPDAVTAPFKVDPFRGSRNGEVSRQWASRPADQRFISLSSLRDHLQRRADSTRPSIVPAKRLEFIAPDPQSIEDTHKLAVALPGGDLVGPTHWSFGQLASLADFSAKELRKLPSQLVADVLTYQMRNARSVEEVKVFDCEGSLSAVTGPGYGWIKDAEVVEAVQQIAGNGTGDMRWKIPGVMNWSDHTYDPFAPVTSNSTTLYASDRDLFIFLVDDTRPIIVGTLKDGSPDYMFRGFYLANSEVGAGALKLCTFYLRGVCQNRCLWGLNTSKRCHPAHVAGSRPLRRRGDPGVAVVSEGSDRSLIEGVQKAKEAIIAKEQSEALTFLRDRGIRPSGQRRLRC